MGGSIIFGTAFPIVKQNAKYIGVFVFASFVLLVIFELWFEIDELIISTLGRDKTLTQRTDLWEAALAMVTNPLLGAGYDSFWLGDRLTKLWAIFWWHPIQAHNAYIETYLNLGWIGLFLFIGIVISCYKSIRKSIIYDYDYGRWRLTFLITSLVIGFTEGVLKGVGIVWFVFLLNAMGGSFNPQSDI
jgi:O-antigen ligase